MMLCKLPLTKEQQDFAAEHHRLVYKFLNDNHLPEDEFYDVVIFSYLKSVQDFSSRESLQAYSFSTIAWRYMSRSLSNYFKGQFRQKCHAEIISIHIGPYQDVPSLEESLPAQDNWTQYMEMQFLLHDLAGRVSSQQMKIVREKMYGYGIREISRRQKLPMKRIKEMLAEVRIVFLDMCRE